MSTKALLFPVALVLVCAGCAVGADPGYSVVVESACDAPTSFAVVGDRDLEGDPAEIDNYLVTVAAGGTREVGTTDGSNYIVVKNLNEPVRTVIELDVSSAEPSPIHTLTQSECDGST